VYPIIAIFTLAKETSSSEKLIFRRNVAEDIGHLFFSVFTLKLVEILGEVTMINWHLAEGPI
jgi:hypothetical protein